MELIARAARGDADAAVVRREGEHAAAIGDVDLGAGKIDAGPVRVVAAGERLALAVLRRVHRVGDERVVAFGADDVSRGLAHGRAVAAVADDAGDGVAVHRDLVDPEGFAQFGACGDRGVDEDLVEQVAARAVGDAVHRRLHQHVIALETP